MHSPTTQVLSQASRCEEAISYNSQSHLAFLQGKVNSAHYIAQVVNLVLLPFLRQEGDVLFSRTTHIYIWLLQCNMLFMVYNSCPGQQDPQISRQLNLMKWELTLSPEPVTTMQQQVQDAWNNVLQEDIRPVHDRLHLRIHACIAARWVYTVY